MVLVALAGGREGGLALIFTGCREGEEGGRERDGRGEHKCVAKLGRAGCPGIDYCKP